MPPVHREEKPCLKLLPAEVGRENSQHLDKRPPFSDLAATPQSPVSGSPFDYCPTPTSSPARATKGLLPKSQVPSATSHKEERDSLV